MTTPDGTRLAMKFGEGSLHDFLRDGAWPRDTYAVEQKLDGTRTIVVVTPTHIRFLGHGGKALGHTAATQHFARLTKGLAPIQRLVAAAGADSEAVLDGEVMTDTGTLHIFDLPYLRVTPVPGITEATPYRDRRAALDTLADLFFAPIFATRSEQTPEGAAALIARVKEQGGEGVMVKRLDAPYGAGKRVTHSLKLKFTKTADVIVTARNVDGHCNAELAVLNDAGGMVPIGSMTMIGKPDAKVGDVVEVRYLYLGAGGRLYQPRMLRLRPDKTMADCRLDQFTVYTKAVL